MSMVCIFIGGKYPTSFLFWGEGGGANVHFCQSFGVGWGTNVTFNVYSDYLVLFDVL